MIRATSALPPITDYSRTSRHVRNPYMSAKLSRPLPHGFDRRSYPFVCPLLQSPSCRPDPQYLNAVARRAGQRMAVALSVPRAPNFQATP